MFNTTGPHYCPNCPSSFNSKRKSLIRQSLKLVESNYSGCGVDIAQCPNCNKFFQISFRVDEIKDVTEKFTK